MRAQLSAALRAVLVFTVLCGVAYPLAVTVVAGALFPGRAEGSLVEHDGRVVGSALLGQPFEGPEWFHPRPSAAGDGYDAMASSASNLGPNNPELIDTVAERAVAYRELNGLAEGAEVPTDAVTASGSGLDPHISPANARLQAPRVAAERDLAVAEVLSLVDQHTESGALGFVGEDGVNVLALNIALDDVE